MDDGPVRLDAGAHLVFGPVVQERHRKEHPTPAARHAAQLGERPPEVGHVLEHVRVDHEVEGLVGEGKAAQVLVPDQLQANPPALAGSGASVQVLAPYHFLDAVGEPLGRTS